MQSEEVVRFTDSAATRVFELGLDHDEVLHALKFDHFKQPGYDHGRYAHFVKVGGLPLKVVTGPSLADPTATMIIHVTALELDARAIAAAHRRHAPEGRS